MSRETALDRCLLEINTSLELVGELQNQLKKVQDTVAHGAYERASESFSTQDSEADSLAL